MNPDRFKIYVFCMLSVFNSNSTFSTLQIRCLHTAAIQNAEARLKTFSIYRWNPDKPDEKPYMQKYKIDLNT